MAVEAGGDLFMGVVQQVNEILNPYKGDSAQEGGKRRSHSHSRRKRRRRPTRKSRRRTTAKRSRSMSRSRRRIRRRSRRGRAARLTKRTRRASKRGGGWWKKKKPPPPRPDAFNPNMNKPLTEDERQRREGIDDAYAKAYAEQLNKSFRY